MDDYYAPLVAMIESGIENGFVKAEHKVTPAAAAAALARMTRRGPQGFIVVDSDPASLVARLRTHVVPKGYDLNWDLSNI